MQKSHSIISVCVSFQIPVTVNLLNAQGDFMRIILSYLTSLGRGNRKLAGVYLVPAVTASVSPSPIRPAGPCPAEKALLQEIKWRHAARSSMPQ